MVGQKKAPRTVFLKKFLSGLLSELWLPALDVFRGHPSTGLPLRLPLSCHASTRFARVFHLLLQHCGQFIKFISLKATTFTRIHFPFLSFSLVSISRCFPPPNPRRNCETHDGLYGRMPAKRTPSSVRYEKHISAARYCCRLRRSLPPQVRTKPGNAQR